MPSARATASCGNSRMRFTRAACPAPIAAESATSPAENNTIPLPAASSPAPNASIAAPMRTKEGTATVSRSPATPRIVRAPARATKPLTISPQDIVPSSMRGGARRPIAMAARMRAPDPTTVPFIAMRAMANIARAPASPTRPLASSSHPMPPIILTAAVIPWIATATTASPRPIVAMFGGISRMAPAMIRRDPARPTIPLARSFQLNPANLETEAVMMPTPTPTSASPTPIPAIPLGMSRMAPARTRIAPARPARPLASSPQDKSARPLTAPTRILMPMASGIIASAVRMRGPWTLLNPKAPAIRIASAPATPTRPFASSSQLRSASDLIATANIATAVDRRIKATAIAGSDAAPLTPAIFDRTVRAPMSSVKATVMAPRARPKAPGSIVERSLSETARTPTAMAILRMMLALMSCCMTLSAPVKLSNSPAIPSKAPEMLANAPLIVSRIPPPPPRPKRPSKPPLKTFRKAIATVAMAPPPRRAVMLPMLKKLRSWSPIPMRKSVIGLSS